jgi:hypothetical protein
MSERKQFMDFLADVKPIPKMIKLKAWDNKILHVRALTPGEQKELRKLADENSDMDVKVFVVMRGLVDSDGNQMIDDQSAFDNVGYDAICELFDKITDVTTNKLMQEAVRGK